MRMLLLVLGLLAPAVGCAAESKPPSLEHRFYISPDEVRRWDSRTLAELLVQRLHRECDLAGRQSVEDRPIGDDATLVMMISTSVIRSVAKHGFLNQHQTSTSGGHHLIPIRFATEQELAMARLPYSRRGLELLPKYALLVVNRPDFGSFSLPTRYGAVAVVFKKEVLKRATWTYADSLDFHFQVGKFNNGGAANPVLTHTFNYRKKPEDRNRCGNYCEAQIWGALSLEDVDYLMIGEDEPVTRAMWDSGLRIYRYAFSSDAPARFVRGELIIKATTGDIVEDSVEGFSRAADNYLENNKYAAMEDNSLIGFLADVTLSGRRRLIGEIAARFKSSVIVRELEKALGSEDDLTRSLALHGLSELPWRDFRPYLLKGLSDGHPLVRTASIAFASEHQDDEEIARLLKALAVRPPLELLQTGEWLDRLHKQRFCD